MKIQSLLNIVAILFLATGVASRAWAADAAAKPDVVQCSVSVTYEAMAGFPVEEGQPQPALNPRRVSYTAQISIVGLSGDDPSLNLSLTYLDNPNPAQSGGELHLHKVGRFNRASGLQILRDPISGGLLVRQGRIGAPVYFEAVFAGNFLQTGLAASTGEIPFSPQRMKLSVKAADLDEAGGRWDLQGLTNHPSLSNLAPDNCVVF